MTSLNMIDLIDATIACDGPLLYTGTGTIAGDLFMRHHALLAGQLYEAAKEDDAVKTRELLLQARQFYEGLQ